LNSWKFTGEVKPLQESLVLHTMTLFIPNIFNDVLNFFFTNHIVLFLCKYKDIESGRSYSNHSTQLFDADMSVNLCEVDFGSQIRHSGTDVTSNLVSKYCFSLAEGLGRVQCSVSNRSGLPGCGPGWNGPRGSGPGHGPPSYPNWVTSAGLLPGPDIYPRFFG
jgi:hypothetical protein